MKMVVLPRTAIKVADIRNPVAKTMAVDRGAMAKIVLAALSAEGRAANDLEATMVVMDTEMIAGTETTETEATVETEMIDIETTRMTGIATARMVSSSGAQLLAQVMEGQKRPARMLSIIFLTKTLAQAERTANRAVVEIASAIDEAGRIGTDLCASTVVTSRGAERMAAAAAALGAAAVAVAHAAIHQCWLCPMVKSRPLEMMTMWCVLKRNLLNTNRLFGKRLLSIWITLT